MCLRCRISIRNNFGNKNGNSILKNFVENFSKPYFAQANVSRFSVMSVFVFRNLWLEIRNRIGKLKWKYFVFLTVCRFTFTNSSYKKLLVWFLSENILLYLSFSYICNVQWTKYATSCSCKTLAVTLGRPTRTTETGKLKTDRVSITKKQKIKIWLF